MPRTEFIPSRHGFDFANQYTNYLALGITTHGRCGGMAYAALDYYCHNTPIPPSQYDVSAHTVGMSSRGDCRYDVFITDAGGSARYSHFFRNGWRDWIHISDSIASAAGSASWSDNRVDVFAI